jgi:hypothetical protein
MDDLHLLLQEVKITPPYILVGALLARAKGPVGAFVLYR